jgi:hypothetical protein
MHKWDMPNVILLFMVQNSQFLLWNKYPIVFHLYLYFCTIMYNVYNNNYYYYDNTVYICTHQENIFANFVIDSQW